MTPDRLLFHADYLLRPISFFLFSIQIAGWEIDWRVIFDGQISVVVVIIIGSGIVKCEQQQCVVDPFIKQSCLDARRIAFTMAVRSGIVLRSILILVYLFILSSGKSRIIHLPSLIFTSPSRLSNWMGILCDDVDEKTDSTRSSWPFLFRFNYLVKTGIYSIFFLFSGTNKDKRNVRALKWNGQEESCPFPFQFYIPRLIISYPRPLCHSLLWAEFNHFKVIFNPEKMYS